MLFASDSVEITKQRESTLARTHMHRTDEHAPNTCQTFMNGIMYIQLWSQRRNRLEKNARAKYACEANSLRSGVVKGSVAKTKIDNLWQYHLEKWLETSFRCTILQSGESTDKSLQLLSPNTTQYSQQIFCSNYTCQCSSFETRFNRFVPSLTACTRHNSV